MKRCPGYKREAHSLPLADFAGNRSRKDGLQKRCRACHSACMKAYRTRCKETPREVLSALRHPNGTKRCARCLKVGRSALRPLEDFYNSNGTSDGMYNSCKDCVRELRWESYGVIDMTVERYAAMLAQQNNLCAIPSCGVSGTDSRVLDVDHNHETGEVRGLLCRNCNTIAGHCGESTTVLLDLVVYLLR